MPTNKQPAQETSEQLSPAPISQASTTGGATDNATHQITITQWATWVLELHEDGNLSESVDYAFMTMWGHYSPSEREALLKDDKIRAAAAILDVDSLNPVGDILEKASECIDQIARLLSPVEFHSADRTDSPDSRYEQILHFRGELNHAVYCLNALKDWKS